MAQYQPYPKFLYHPNAQPAVVSDDLHWTGSGLPPIGWSATPGRAASFPPVQVNNEDQEAYYVSRGYNPGSAGDLKAWESAVVAPKPPGFVQRQYPYFDDRGRIVEDPHKPEPPDPNYPKWIDMPDGTQVIARNAAHERELCPPPAPTGVEAECLALIMGAAENAARGLTVHEVGEYRSSGTAADDAAVPNPDVAGVSVDLSKGTVTMVNNSTGEIISSEGPIVIEGAEVVITLERERRPPDADNGGEPIPGSSIPAQHLGIREHSRAEAKQPDETEDDLFTQAVALGIKIDRRWKRATLQAEIDKALSA